jgi:hypothetical protein
MALLKRNLVVVLALILALTAVLPMISVTNAQGAEDNSVVVSGLSIRINGELVDYNPHTVYLNDEVLIPGKAVAKLLNIGLQWDKQLDMLLVSKDGKPVMQLFPNTTSQKVSTEDGFYSNASSKRAPLVKNGTVLIPLGFVAEKLGYEWSFETYPKAIVPKAVPSADPFAKKFKTNLDLFFEADRKLKAAEKQLATVEKKFPKKFVVSGLIVHVAEDFYIVSGDVYDSAKDVMVKNDEYVYVQAGNSGVLNSRITDVNMYDWGIGTYNKMSLNKYSENKTTAHLQATKGLLEQISKLKQQRSSFFNIAIASRNKTYFEIDKMYSGLIKKYPAAETRLRFEQMLNHIKYARGLGLRTAGETKDDAGHVERKFEALNPFLNKQNASVEDAKLQVIGGLQLLEALNGFDNEKTTDDIRNSLNEIAVEMPDIVINSTVSPLLMMLGVQSLMDNRKNDEANFLANYAVNVKGNPYKTALFDAIKQIELRNKIKVD